MEVSRLVAVASDIAAGADGALAAGDRERSRLGNSGQSRL